MKTNVLGVLLAFTACAAHAEDSRKWTAGDFTEQGTFVSLEEDVVTIRLDSGEEVEVDLAALSEGDRQYAHRVKGERNSASSNPTKPYSDGHSGSSPALRAAPTPASAPFDSKQADTHQRAWAAHLACDVEQVNSIGMRLRLIPPGVFLMGGSAESVKVSLTKPYFVSIHEITNAQWRQVMRYGAPSDWTDDTQPVGNVTWEDAVDFCDKLSQSLAEQVAHRRYRLPTEAEWEFACRAGTVTGFSHGEAAGTEYMWSNVGGVSFDSQTHSVGTKRPNPWGLYDMHGNVWEWCSDWSAPYATDAQLIDPVGPTDGKQRILRGGSAESFPGQCASDFRGRVDPSRCNRFLGFRVVMEAQVTAGDPLATAPSEGTSAGRPAQASRQNTPDRMQKQKSKTKEEVASHNAPILQAAEAQIRNLKGWEQKYGLGSQPVPQLGGGLSRDGAPPTAMQPSYADKVSLGYSVLLTLGDVYSLPSGGTVRTPKAVYRSVADFIHANRDVIGLWAEAVECTFRETRMQQYMLRRDDGTVTSAGTEWSNALRQISR